MCMKIGIISCARDGKEAAKRRQIIGGEGSRFQIVHRGGGIFVGVQLMCRDLTVAELSTKESWTSPMVKLGESACTFKGFSSLPVQ